MDGDENSKLRLEASLLGITLCNECHRNNSVFIFSQEQLCEPCFKDKYGNLILRAENGEYFGGHKLHLAGGKFGDFESGKMYLTNTHFIFNKTSKDSQKIWEIIIPFVAIDLNKWQISEESRRKNIVMGGVGNDDVMIAGGSINESGKRHRLVIPFVDENGINQSPVFGISSLSGNAIREWASKFYQAVIADRKNLKKETINNAIASKENNSIADPLTIAKIRFAKGEISKEEFEEMKKLLE
jgi:hypothetical protein